MKKIEDYFDMPTVAQLAEMWPKGSYSVVAMTDPKPTNLSPLAIAAGISQQEFITLTLKKFSASGHIGATRPIRKVVFSETNKTAWEEIKQMVEAKKPLNQIVFDGCRLVTITSKVPYYPTRRNPTTGETEQLTYPMDRGDHKQGEPIKTRSHKFFLFEDDPLGTELGRRLDTAMWLEDYDINEGAEAEDVD